MRQKTRWMEKSFFTRLTILWLIVSISVRTGSALKCWKCIAHDCETDPENNYKASKIECDDGRQCMKVRYRMYDNITHYDSVIRTCTDQPCQQISTHEFDECIATPKQYMIGGCTLRSCCADRDYCNSAVASYCRTHFLMVLISVLLVTLF